MARTYSDTVTTPAAAKTVTATDRPFVSLMSDFGGRDASAGIMRAVVTGICPRAAIVDLAHEVNKFAIRDGALLLWSAVPYLPIGAHVAVVDPGVGTARKGIAVQTARGDYLVGPDNGLLMPAAARLGGITSAHLLENPRYSLSPVSSSFHGRDVFAPAAAHLADGVAIEELGRAVDPRRLMELEWPRPEISRGRLRSNAIYIDSFGNTKLSALLDDLASAIPNLRVGEPLVVRIGQGAGAREVTVTWAETFGSVPEGAPLLTVDSYGRISLSVHQGSAAEQIGVGLDDIVEVSRAATSQQPARPATPPARPPQPTR
jgi:S-adenosylmethionine hydrolase